MKIPLIMRKQYQGQLSASMLYYSFVQNRFYGWFFFLRKDYFNQKNKKHRNLLRCRFQNGDLGRTRTCDLLIRSQTLYPAELRGQQQYLF